jgi:mono/diheme cytochrome c family protein
MRRIAVLLMLLALLASVAAAGCGGGEEAAPTAETVEGGGAETGETTETETAETETTETETETEGGGGAQGGPAAGEEVFATAGCGGCHTLEAAGSSGTVGPNLDESKPDFDLVVDRVTNGQGAMPSFKDQLSAQDIDNVAAYVVQSTG